MFRGKFNTAVFGKPKTQYHDTPLDSVYNMVPVMRVFKGPITPSPLKPIIKILYFHGRGAHRELFREHLERTCDLLDKKLNGDIQGIYILCPDYPGYDDRLPWPMKMEDMSGHDWEFWLREVKAGFVNWHPEVLSLDIYWGHSLGTGFATWCFDTANYSFSPMSDILILQAPFTSLKEFVDRVDTWKARGLVWFWHSSYEYFPNHERLKVMRDTGVHPYVIIMEGENDVVCPPHPELELMADKYCSLKGAHSTHDGYFNYNVSKITCKLISEAIEDLYKYHIKCKEKGGVKETEAASES